MTKAVSFRQVGVLRAVAHMTLGHVPDFLVIFLAFIRFYLTELRTLLSLELGLWHSWGACLPVLASCPQTSKSSVQTLL